MAKSSRFDDRILPARYYLLLIELMRSQGVPLNHLLERIGVDRACLIEPDSLLSLDQVDALIEAAVESTGRDDLGFHLGRLIKPSNHELLGYALMTSATLDEALRMATRYWALITPTFTAIHEPVAGGAHLHLQPALALKPLSARFHIEAIATAFHAEIDFLLATRIPTYTIQLPASLANAASRYRQLAPARVRFDVDHDEGMRIELPTAMLERPLALADRHALKLARQRCDDELSRLSRQGSLSDWIMMMLDQTSDHQPRQQELARILHLSTRTLNRRLADEGTRFRELGLHSRHRRACRLLVESDLPITRIALQLGFHDGANFTRAFRRAEGISPADYRKTSII